MSRIVLIRGGGARQHRVGGIPITAGGGVTPDVLEDFNYATDQELRSSSTFVTAEDNEGAGAFSLGLSGGPAVSQTGKCMKYTLTTFATPGAGGTTSRRISVPSKQELWIEWWEKWSTNFRIDSGFSGGAAYKQCAVVAPSPTTGRFGMEPGNGENGVWGFYSTNDDFKESSAPVSMASLETDTWTRFRQHVRLPSLHEIQIGNGSLYSLTTFHSSAANLYRWIIGENINQRPQSSLGTPIISIGYIQLWWTQSPGWGT